MATRDWTNSLGNNDGSNPANWTGSGAFLTTDVLQCNGSQSQANVTFTSNISIQNFNVTSGYTGAWLLGTCTATCTAASTFSVNGTRSFGTGGIILNGNNINQTIPNATVATASSTITSNGTGNTLTDLRTGTSDLFGSITINNSCVLTFTGSGSGTIFIYNVITLGTNSTWTSNLTTGLYCSSSGGNATPYIMNAGATWNGAGYVVVSPQGAKNVYCGSLTYTGSASGNGHYFIDEASGLMNFYFSGSMNFGTVNLWLIEDCGGATCNFYFGSSIITCNYLYFGCASSTATCYMYMQSSTWNVVLFISQYATLQTYVDFGTAYFYIKSLTLHSTDSVTSHGTEHWIFNAQGGSINAGGHTIGIVVIAVGGGHTTSLGANLTCTFYILQSGSLTKGSYTLTVNGSMAITAAAGLNIGASETMLRKKKPTLSSGLKIGASETMLRKRPVSISGGLKIASASTMARTRTIAANSGLKIGASVVPLRTRTIAVNSGLKIGVQVPVLRQRNIAIASGIQIGNAASMLRQRSICIKSGLKLGCAFTMSRGRLVTLDSGFKFGNSLILSIWIGYLWVRSADNSTWVKVSNIYSM